MGDLPINLSTERFERATDFLLANARLLERRLYDVHFRDGPKEAVTSSVGAYRNRDGGLGWGLEPDTTSPESQPLFTIMGLESLRQVGALDAMLLQNSLPYFESVLTDEGGIPWMFRPSGRYPRADHFENVSERATIAATAPVLALCIEFGVVRPWMKVAETFVWREMARQGDDHAMCAACMKRRAAFLAQRTSEARGAREIEALRLRVSSDAVLCTDPAEADWGLYGHPSSVSYAPSPDSLLRGAFSMHRIDEDLDTLIERQCTDGRWATNYGISERTRLDWDGIYTLESLLTLRAYGRIVDE
ncbi:MAG: hypothetical protein QGI68_21380 [Pseudomonadales bacterium]|nr:hypothetical protein [Pseudomonadales bacterium]MDP7360024.1 hypothetical protein [Pseudomonadales bacterium]MDP7598097.1 hypothetical protein [Pseudomonadales bacterium]HJN49406.1 hypothetical protein [Pseudomonadales bacterium]